VFPQLPAQIAASSKFQLRFSQRLSVRRLFMCRKSMRRDALEFTGAAPARLAAVVRTRGGGQVVVFTLFPVPFKDRRPLACMFCKKALRKFCSPALED